MDTAAKKDKDSNLIEKFGSRFAGLVKDIHEAYPERDIFSMMRQLVAKFCASPPWADRVTVASGMALHAGAFAVYWGRDPETGQIMTLLQGRNGPKVGGQYPLGLVGGYLNRYEESSAGAVREFEEEVINAYGKPIFRPDETRLCLLANHKDYFIPDRPALDDCAFAYELSPDEISKVKIYCEAMKDPAYYSRVKELSNQEVCGFDWVPLEDAINPNGPWHKRMQFDIHSCALAEVAHRLQEHDAQRSFIEEKVLPQLDRDVGETLLAGLKGPFHTMENSKGFSSMPPHGEHGRRGKGWKDRTAIHDKLGPEKTGVLGV